MLKIATVCSGIGAPEKALKNLGMPYEVAFFSEIDNHAIRSYCAINNEEKSKNLGDLSKINYDTLPNDIDLIVGGTPCQSFSASGKGEGGVEGSGTKSSLMWYYIKMIERIKPKVVVWENVAAVLSSKHIRTYFKFFSTFTALGYKVYADLLNAKFFNVPQNRVRIFLIAIRKDIDIKYKFPYGYDSGIRIKHILQDDVPKKFFVKDLSDIDKFRNWYSATHTAMMLGKVKGTVFKQNNLVLFIEGITGCLTTKQGDYIFDDRQEREKPIRHYTPLESMRFMGFTKEDYLACRGAGVPDNELYFQSGNSIAVPVLMAIFGELYNVPWREKVFKERYKTQKQLLYELPLLSYIKDKENAA